MKFKILFLSLLGMLFIQSCGKSSTDSEVATDDEPVNTEDNNTITGAKLVAAALDLPACDSAALGHLFYVLEDEEFQVCTADGYSVIDLSGKDGEDGDNGIAGANGKSCDVTDNGDGTYDLSCEDGNTVTLSDGSDGATGAPGTDGKSCDVTDNGDGTYDLSCEDGNTVTLSDGSDGANGTSIEWLGSLNEKPTSPTLNQAFYWKQGGMSCIWDGSSWELLSTNGNIPSVSTCEATFTDNRDGQEYEWVKIGTQVWMAENLNYSGDDGSGNKTTTLGYCYGNTTDNGDNSNCDTYGRLYDWATIMGINASNNNTLWSGSDANHQGLCPTGWHLPSDNEWETLASYVANDAGLTGYSGDDWAEIGQKLKSTTGWTTYPGISSDDAYGFSGLPGGYRNSNGSYNNVGYYGYWWSSTEYSSTYAYGRRLSYDGDYFHRDYYYKAGANSVRCLQDTP